MKTDLQAKQTAREETSLSVNEVSAKEQNQIILYRPNDTISLEVRLENDMVWLTANQMSALFDREESNIRRHIINIFNEDELERDINVHFLHVNGIKNNKQFYSTDAARYVPIAIGLN